MRETRTVQSSIFDSYSKHDHGVLLETLSDRLDAHPDILELLSADLIDPKRKAVGCRGLSVESVLRCLLLKQILGISYEKLSFHLSDSITYRTFVRLPAKRFPSRAGLQSVIRKIQPQTLQAVHEKLCTHWHDQQLLQHDCIRIDSTVVESHIAPPSDSALLDDCVRVLSRYLATCHRYTGLRVRFTDQRKKSKRLAFAIFYAKVTEKEELYPQLIACVAVVLKQIDRTLAQLEDRGDENDSFMRWVTEVEHYRGLLLRVVDQTQQRVYEKRDVPAEQKLVSIFEPHTDIIVKGARDIQYGHKVNLATDRQGLITYFEILDGNPSDKVLYLPVLDSHQALFDELPHTSIADGGFASKTNVTVARAAGVTRSAFHKRAGLGFHDMGVKRKTLNKLRAFRAGIEGNISELKRAFGMSRVRWKQHDGFKAFVWSSVLAYNLIRLCRISTA